MGTIKYGTTLWIQDSNIRTDTVLQATGQGYGVKRFRSGVTGYGVRRVPGYTQCTAIRECMQKAEVICSGTEAGGARGSRRLPIPARFGPDKYDTKREGTGFLSARSSCEQERV